MQVFKCKDIEWIKNLLNRSSNNRQLTEMEYRHFGMICERAGATYLFITDQIQFYQFLNKAFNPFSVDAPENMEIPVKDISRYSTLKYRRFMDEIEDNIILLDNGEDFEEINTVYDSLPVKFNNIIVGMDKVRKEYAISLMPKRVQAQFRKTAVS